MLSPFGLVGPTYPSQNVSADAERCVNWYPEFIENGGTGRVKVSLMNRPGAKGWATVNTGVGRGVIALNAGRMFAVFGNHLWELNPDKTMTDRGTLSFSTGLVTIDSNGTSLFIVEPGPNSSTAGHAWNYVLATNTLTELTGSGALTGVNPYLGGFCDGFFVLLIRNTSQFRISALFDGTTWPGTAVAAINQFPDQIVGMKIIHRSIYLFGTFNSSVFYNSGAAVMPFIPDPSAAIEYGASSAFCIQQMNDSLFCLSTNKAGRAIVVRYDGYRPTRVSTHAVENAIWTYVMAQSTTAAETLATAYAFVYEEEGHQFYVLTIPGMTSSWCYDAVSGLWWEWSDYDGANFTPARPAAYAAGFNRNLAVDASSGAVFEMSIYQPDDAALGHSIYRFRRSPYLCAENQWQRHAALELAVDCDASLRTWNLRFSDDATASWSTPAGFTVPAAAKNGGGQRAYWWRLGRTRNRVYEVSVIDSGGTKGSKIVDGWLRI